MTQRFLDHIYLTNHAIKETFIKQSATIIGALLHVRRCIQDHGLRAINAKMCVRVDALDM